MHFAGEAGSLDVKQRTPPVAAFALLPFAIAGAIVNYPTYRLIGFLTNRLSKENEMRATMKFVGALMFYPLTWIAIVVWWRINFLAAIATVIAIPILGYTALRVFESIAFWLERPRKDLAAKREAIRDEILRVWEQMSG